MKAKFHRILVAIARHKSASDVFHQALTFAQQNHSQLIVIHCTRLQVLSQVGTLLDSSFGLVNPVRKQQLEREHQVQINQAAQWLRTYALEAQARGVCTEAVHQLGEPSIQICQLARQLNADLIVMGRSRKPDWQQQLFGSQTNQVARHAPCAVMILPITSSIQRLPDQKVARSSVNQSHRADLQSARSTGDIHTPFAWTQ